MAIKKVYELSVDMKRTSVRVNVPVLVQGDSAEFRIRLADNGVVLSTEELNGITSVTMQSGFDAQTIIETIGTLEGSTAVFRLQKGELFRSGTVQAMVQLADADDRISTLRFEYQVIPELSGNYIPDEQDITVFQRYMNDAQAKIDEMAATDVAQLTVKLAETAKKDEVQSGLNNKRDKLIQIGTSDITPELQSAIAGTAPIANSIPANESVAVNSLNQSLKRFHETLADDILERRESKNLYDKTMAIDNAYIYDQTGAIRTDSTDLAFTGYVPVEESKNYIFHIDVGTISTVTYWSNSVKLERVSAGSKSFPFVTPATCTHVSANLKLGTGHSTATFESAISTLQLEEGSVATSYEPYGEFYNAEKVKRTVSFFRESRNLYDKMLAVDNAYIYDSDGGVRTDTNALLYTGFVPVASEKTLTLSVDGKVISSLTFWNGNTRIERVSVLASSFTFTTPIYCTHITANIRVTAGHTSEEFNDVIATIQLEEGSAVTSYERYGFTLKEEHLPQTTINPTPLTSSILKGKKWVIDGDSNSEYNSTAIKKYHDLISEETGVIVSNFAKSGSGYLPYTPDGTTRQPVHTRIASYGGDADYITILAGGNNVGDIFNGVHALGVFGDTDPDLSYYGALDYTFKTIIAKFPTKKIAALSQFQRGNQSDREEVMQNMVKALKEVCGYYGVPVLDLYNGGNIHAKNPTFVASVMPDNIHINDIGHELLFNKIQKFLESL